MSKIRAQMITCPLRVAAWRRPQAPALLTVDGVVAYGDLDARVSAAARQLAAQQCRPGDVVGIYRAIDVDTIVAVLALLRLGAVACLLNLRNPPALLARQLADVRAAFVLSDAAGMPFHAGACARLVLTAEGAEQTPTGMQRLEMERLATLLFTSGSGAEPRAAAHTYGNHFAAASASNRHNGLAAEDGWLLSLPLYHVSGLGIIFRCLLAGAAIVLPADGVALEESVLLPGVTHLSLVPTQLQRLLATPGAASALSRLQLILVGGAPVPDAVMNQALARGWPVRKTYGLTEMTSQVTTVPPHASRAKCLTAGTVLPFSELRLSPDGEIGVRGPMLFSGYMEQGRLVHPVDAEGWYATGDLGDCDEVGYLTVRGRKDNLFISGGENVQPEEIEMALGGLADVRQAVVVPVPDAEFGQRPAAFVKRASGVLDPAGLAAELAAVLPRYKIPVEFHVWPEEVDSIPPKLQRRYFLERVQSALATGGP